MDKMTPTTPPRRQAGRADNGLTTLEWLLIVAAVAGLAALAVVLVQNVVDETAEQIAGSSARITAAQVAAEAINTGDDNDADKRSACNRLSITYSDAFADTPLRTSFWTDSNTSADTGGVCAIVAQTVANNINTANRAAANATEPQACIDARGTNASDRGGKTVAVWDRSRTTGDRCALS